MQRQVQLYCAFDIKMMVDQLKREAKHAMICHNLGLLFLINNTITNDK